MDTIDTQGKAEDNLRIMLGKKLRRLREQAGMSQQKLADLSGMKQPMINRFETGQRRMLVSHVQALAPALSIAPAELLPPNIGMHASPVPPAAVPVHSPLGMMPVLDDQDRTVDETPVPPVLATSRERYAMYMPDSSMAPRYAAGTLLHLAPYKPAAPGRGVILLLQDGKRLVREWVGKESTYLTVKRYGAEPGTENHPIDSVAAVHVIVGTVEV
jgi:transcriptional regulator with XRE-family HTH domain